MSSSRDKLDSLYVIFRGMIREEIDSTPGFRELTGRSDFPANVEAERAILGAILLDGSARLAECGDLKTEDFVLDSHQRIFTVMKHMIEAGRSVDMVTLPEDMRRLGMLEEIHATPVAYLSSLTEGLPRNLAVKQYAQIVKEKAVRRQIINACSAAITKAADASLTPAEIVEQLGKDLKGCKR